MTHSGPSSAIRKVDVEEHKTLEVADQNAAIFVKALVVKAGLARDGCLPRISADNLEGDYTHFLERKLKHTKDVLNLFPEALIELADMGGESLVIWANERTISKFGEKILDNPVTDFIPSDRWSSIYETLLRHGKTEDVKFKKDDNIYELSGFYVDTGGQIESRQGYS